MSEKASRNRIILAGCAGCGCLIVVAAAALFLLGLVGARTAIDSAEDAAIQGGGLESEVPDLVELGGDLAVLADGSIVATDTVAGGETMQYRTREGGVLPAENDRARVEVAGFGIQPGEPGRHGLFWQFEVTVREGDLQHVLVEDVTVEAGRDPLSVRPVELVRDQAPVLEAGRWRGKTTTYLLAREAFPWFYSNEDTVRVFRFQLEFADGTATTLFQRTQHEGPVKAQVREQLSAIDSGE